MCFLTCILLTSANDSDTVKAAKANLDMKIMQHKPNTTLDEITPQDDDVAETGSTMCARSPFTSVFQALLDKALSLNSEGKTGEKNIFFCPQSIDGLMDTHMAIFPLWSGVLLGDLNRYLEHTSINRLQHHRTRESNCHVEEWFWIIKQSILQQKKFFRPAYFIHKMYSSLQGRYKEHIMAQNLTLARSHPCPKPTVMDQEEQWAKKNNIFSTL